jgi:DNA replication and repair protein RecF
MITSLRLQHFRSYQDARFDFDEGVTIIVGPNASGKTNLLEALLVIALGHSYRVPDDELLQFGQEWSRLDAALAGDQERTLKLENRNEHLYKTLLADGKEYKRLTMAHLLPVVLFEPNDLLLLTGSPDRRRDYMDDLLTQLRPGFSALRAQYRRTLTQRNALLKKGFRQAETQLFAWDLRLSELAGELFAARQWLIEQLEARLPQIYQELSQATATVSLEYKTKLPTDHYASALLRKLSSSAELDCIRGFTTAGPHRDDMQLSFDGTPAEQTASRGEVRTVLLGLKLIELELLEAMRDQKPLLLLDDVFSELDVTRRKALTRFVSQYQTFITTTDADIAARHFPRSSRVISLPNET